MNRRLTPETDEQRRIDNGDTAPLLDFAEGLEIERDELRSDLEFRRGLFKLQEEQLNEVRSERDDLKFQLATAMMAIRLQQRREQQTNE